MKLCEECRARIGLKRSLGTDRMTRVAGRRGDAQLESMECLGCDVCQGEKPARQYGDGDVLAALVRTVAALREAS